MQNTGKTSIFNPENPVDPVTKPTLQFSWKNPVKLGNGLAIGRQYFESCEANVFLCRMKIDFVKRFKSVVSLDNDVRVVGVVKTDVNFSRCYFFDFVLRKTNKRISHFVDQWL